MAMKDGWLDRIGDYKVEHRPLPRNHEAAYIRQENQTGVGTLHTAEGTGIDGVVATLREMGAAYMWGIENNTIYQFRPTWAQQSAERNNESRHVQTSICMVLFCQPVLWLPPNEVLLPLITLMKWYSGQGIPLVNPVPEWPAHYEDMAGQMWANNNIRRQAAQRNHWWPNRKGWWQHGWIPNQGKTWHHDCYKLDEPEILRRSSALPMPEVIWTGATANDFKWVDLKRGDVGYRVGLVQQEMVDRKIDLGKSGPKRNGVDNNFGGKTEAAVKALQLKNGRAFTGVVDEWLWNYLKG